MDLVVLPDGKIMIAGSHSYGYVFRVNTDGTKDTSFESPLLTGSQANSVAVQSNGKVLFTGNFTAVNGVARSGLTRLNADGSVDSQFPQNNYRGKVRVGSDDRIV